MMTTEYPSLRDLPCENYEVFSEEQSKELEKQWMSIFAAYRKNPRAKAYKWEIFAHDYFPNVEAEKAKKSYFQQKAADFIILPNNLEWEDAVKIDRLPDLTTFNQDYLVFPPNMAWTMAFTHEEGWYGPYFAKHPNYVSLVEENMKLIKKKQEIAHAKDKGWI